MSQLQIRAQSVPKDGEEVVSMSPPAQAGEQLPRVRLSEVPEYTLALIAGYILMVTGSLTIAFSILWVGQANNAGAAIILIFETVVRWFCRRSMGFGQLLHCVRDIARNSWAGRAAHARSIRGTQCGYQELIERFRILMPLCHRK